MILRVVMSEKVLYVASPGGLMCNKYGFVVTLWYIYTWMLVYTTYMYANIMPVRFKFKSYMYV